MTQEVLGRIDDPEGFLLDPSLVLYLPLYQLDGASFMSRDAYGHTATVTSATWGLQGRTFNGTNDKITCPDTSLPSGAAARTVIFWIKNLEPAGATDGCYLFNYGTFAAPNSRFFSTYFNVNTADLYFGGYGDDFNTGIKLNDSFFHQIILTYDGTNVRAYKDTAEGSGSPTAKTLNTVLSGNLLLGGQAASAFTNMVMGEFWVYNKVLSAPERQYNYLATKWRYQ